MGIEKGHLTRQPFGSGDIVAVEHGDVFAACQIQPAIARPGNAPVPGIASHANARISVSGDDLQTAIGRAVIDDQQFEIGEGLRQDAVDRLRDIAFLIIDGDEHSDLRISGHESLNLP